MKSIANRWAFASGILAVALGLLLGELIAAWLSPSISPVTAVGGTVIDALPPGVKDWAISLFGTADKVVFISAMALVIAVCAGFAGVLEIRRRYLGAVLIGLLGVLGAVSVLSRALGSLTAAAAPVLAALLSLILLRTFIDRLIAWQGRPNAAAPNAGEDNANVAERRTFLRALSLGAIGTVIAGLATGVVRSSIAGYQAARDALRLPTPAQAAPPIPAGAQLELAGIAPLVTPNNNFYRIDTALVVPVINPDSWQLTVTGMVEQEVTINLAELLAQPMIERYVTIACVSNEVGGDLIGNARWLGWPVRELLARAGVKSGADMVLSRSQDGFTASTPLDALTDDRGSMIAVGMNGELLPSEHGFPARMIVPGLYGFVSATKWITELKVTTFAADEAYWSSRGWSERGPIKQSTRIDTPRNGAAVPSGQLVLGGSAWAQTIGISAVEVKVDDGDWQPAQLAPDISADTWVQWSASVALTPGQHAVQARCTDAAGNVQTATQAAPAPDGASGYHSIRVSAA